MNGEKTKEDGAWQKQSDKLRFSSWFSGRLSFKEAEVIETSSLSRNDVADLGAGRIFS